MNTSARTSKSLLTSTDEFITRYTQAVNTFDVDAVADLFAAGAVFNAPNGRVLRSCVEIRAFFSQLFQAQGTIKVTSAVAQDNQLVLEIGVRARRDASGQLVSDPTAPIRPVAIDHFTFAADGKISRMRFTWLLTRAGSTTRRPPEPTPSVLALGSRPTITGGAWRLANDREIRARALPPPGLRGLAGFP